MPNRISWDSYFMSLATVVAGRSTCSRLSVGAVAVRDRRILATGYNGAPRGLEHCLERGCMREAMGIPSGQRHELCRALHAEQNVIIQAALHGVSLDGAHLYCTHQPCLICAKMLINVGIAKIVFIHPYPDDLAAEMLAEAWVILEQVGGDECPA